MASDREARRRAHSWRSGITRWTCKSTVISVDTKKKELVGNFKNGRQEWQPAGEPDLVDVHDFPEDAMGKAIPDGIYDVASNDGLVSVGVDHDTPVFAVKSIEAWWMRVGRAAIRPTTAGSLCGRGSTAAGTRSTRTPPDPIPVEIDRPFVFLLRDATGAPLFVGQFAMPG